MDQKRFKDFKERDIAKQLGITPSPHSNVLDTWLSQKPPVAENDLRTLESLREELERDALNWRKEDLKMLFISPLLRLADLKNGQFRPFFEPKLSGEVNNLLLSGNIDMVVATGTRDPEQPFFFFHEYKPELESSSDPRGQLLAAMALGQSKNEHPFPIYGCFVVGQIWYFVVLDGAHYTISPPYVATKNEDIVAILQALRQAKAYIEALLKG